MNRSIAAAVALLAGFAIASPIVAAAADDETLLAQAGPDQRGPGTGGMPGMMHGMQGMGEHEGMGPMGEHHGWMHRMMQMSPQQRCEERLARRAGLIAYTVAKLNLTAEQRPAWDKLQGLLQAAADRERQLCASLKPRDQRSQETILDKVGRREQFLTARLQGLQQVRPALEQFYQTLTPEQKAIVDHPFRR